MDELERLRARVVELERHLRERGLVEVTVPLSGACPRCGVTNHSTGTAALRSGDRVQSHAEGTCGIEGCGGWVRMTGEASVPR